MTREAVCREEGDGVAWQVSQDAAQQQQANAGTHAGIGTEQRDGEQRLPRMPAKSRRGAGNGIEGNDVMCFGVDAVQPLRRVVGGDELPVTCSTGWGQGGAGT